MRTACITITTEDGKEAVALQEAPYDKAKATLNAIVANPPKGTISVAFRPYDTKPKFYDLSKPAIGKSDKPKAAAK